MVAARDAEVKALTEKLKAFASETRRLIEQLKAETVSSHINGSRFAYRFRLSCLDPNRGNTDISVPVRVRDRLSRKSWQVIIALCRQIWMRLRENWMRWRN